jgi:hypothetical protein
MLTSREGKLGSLRAVKVFHRADDVSVSHSASSSVAGLSIDVAEAAPQFPADSSAVPHVAFWMTPCHPPLSGEVLSLRGFEYQPFDGCTPFSPQSMQSYPGMYIQSHPSKLHNSVCA